MQKEVFLRIPQSPLENNYVGVLFNKCASCRCAVLLKIGYGCFAVNFAKSSRTPILKDYCEPLFL